MYRLLIAGALLLAATSLRAAPSTPDSFAARYDDLVEFLGREELNPIETAQATLLATQIFGTGTQAMPYVRQRFSVAKTQADAGLAGVFLTCHGGEPERQLIRRATETDVNKRKMIWTDVATEERFFTAVENGEQWRAAVRLLPSASRCRQLAALCLDSRDLLTRRAGLYWGHWVADDAHWKKVAAVAQTDPDKVTRQIARRLLADRSAQAR